MILRLFAVISRVTLIHTKYKDKHNLPYVWRRSVYHLQKYCIMFDVLNFLSIRDGCATIYFLMIIAWLCSFS